ncbi:hypothetical protein [Stetteria hydrogenophila]
MTRASAAIAIAYSVVDVIESIYEDEVPLWEIGVGGSVLAPPRSSTVIIDVCYPGRSGVLGERKLEPLGVTVRVVAGERGAPEYSLVDLYRAIAMQPLQGDGEVIRRLALETARTGVEYALIYTSQGYAAILEGDVYRVRLPFIKAAVLYHTHPEGACSLSYKDLESSLDLMVEGGVGGGAATTSCAAVAYRVGFVVEDDYIKIREAIVRKKQVNPGELRTVRLERVSY